MRNSLSSALLCMVALDMNSASAQDSVPSNATNQPTLKETTVWLESHLVGLKQTTEATTITFDAKKQPAKEIDRHTTTHFNVVLTVRFAGCVLNVEQQNRVEGRSVTYTTSTVSSIPLDRMSQASMKEQAMSAETKGSRSVSWNPDNYVAIQMGGSLGAVNWRRKFTSVPPDPASDTADAGSDDSFSMETEDREIAPRLVKAVNHAIDLCHATSKPEPF